MRYRLRTHHSRVKTTQQYSKEAQRYHPRNFQCIYYIIPDALCTLKTCTLLQAHYQYLPSLPGNALYAAIFGVLIAAQIFLGVRCRSWGFLGGMFGGLVLEIISYVGRIQMHTNPLH
jgi:hypothetical protein